MDICIEVPVLSDNSPTPPPRKLGSMKGLTFIAGGHKIGDYDDEIVQLFESEPDDIPYEN